MWSAQSRCINDKTPANRPQSLEKDFQTAGFKPQCKVLADFYESYGLEGDENEDDDDDEDEDEDDSEEGSEDDESGDEMEE